jgi:hypothetical protein
MKARKASKSAAALLIASLINWVGDIPKIVSIAVSKAFASPKFLAVCIALKKCAMPL